MDRTDKMDRATKRFGRKSDTEDKAPKGEKAAETNAESSAKDTPHAEPSKDAKPVALKPNAQGATAEASMPRDQVAERHGSEMDAMHGRHMQEMKDMHGRHASEMKQMHGRHLEEIGNSGAGAQGEKAPGLPSAKKLAGKGWKTKDKGKSGSEPK